MALARLENASNPDMEIGVSHSTLTSVRELQLLKAKYPIEVTLFGISIEVKPEQSAKASAPMLVTYYVISVSFLNSLN